MKRRQQKQWRFPDRRPIGGINRIIGVVWSMPSYEAARDAVLEIRQRRHELRPGSLIDDATVLPSSDNDGYYVILVGTGDMFSAAFLAGCGASVHRHKGSMLPESKRKQDLITSAYREWVKIGKQERKKTRELLADVKKRYL